MPNTSYSLWHRPQRFIWRLVSSIFEPAICGSFWCQNSPPENCHDDGWLALSRRPWAQKAGSGAEEPHQLFCSLPGLVASILKPQNRSSAISAAGALCYQCWPNKVSHWLAWFKASFRIGEAVAEREFRKWRHDVGSIDWPIQIDLIKWYSLVRTTSNEEFKYSQP